MEYLEKSNSLSPFQSGFGSDHSKQTALLHLTDHVWKGIEIDTVTVVIQFGFHKAFDTITPY